VSRRLGQHFLHDPSILDRIVSALEPTGDDVVVEIGPGLGTLTRRLAPTVGHVVALERDHELAVRLAGDDVDAPAPPPNVTVVETDALEADWPALASAAGATANGDFKVVGNIPYYITSPLIGKALTPPVPRSIVYLVQAEVAARAAAQPGSKTYGALSVGVQVVARVERLFAVRRGAFRPPPAVDSAVIRMTPLETGLVAPERHDAFRRFVGQLFGQRRKQLGRSMRNLWDLEDPEVEAALVAAGVAATQRPETVSPESFVQLFEAIGR
jgi:16S rRNA (adenine1518-N6/adenine1519-N6)-dimethyltransferase